MNYKLLYKTAMLAGEINARSGAETHRVEDTMIRILRMSGFATIETFATSTGIIATLDDPTIEPITSVKRIEHRANDLNRIYLVNRVSRDLCDHKIELEEAYEQLRAIKHCKEYSKSILAVFTIVATVCFTALNGGRGWDFFIAGLNGGILVLLTKIATNRVKSRFMEDMAKSFLIAFTTFGCGRWLLNVHSDIIIISSIMPLVPGIPITNAIRDTLHGDYMSGVSRAMEAFVIALGIAVGIYAGLGFYLIIF